jgi:hypothetical protein
MTSGSRRGSSARFDAPADGHSFRMIAPDGHEAARWAKPIVVQNWFEELKANVPAGGAGK